MGKAALEWKPYCRPFTCQGRQPLSWNQSWVTTGRPSRKQAFTGPLGTLEPGSRDKVMPWAYSAKGPLAAATRTSKLCGSGQAIQARSKQPNWEVIRQVSW